MMQDVQVRVFSLFYSNPQDQHQQRPLNIIARRRISSFVDMFRHRLQHPTISARCGSCLNALQGHEPIGAAKPSTSHTINFRATGV